MAVSQAEFTAAKGYFFDLEIVAKNASDEVTVIAATIRGINGSKRVFRRKKRLDYRVLADVSDIRSALPTGWIVSPDADQIEHVNIWPPTVTCPLTRSQLPRICWGTGTAAWEQRAESSRTLNGFLDMAGQVLGTVNLDSQAR